MALYELHLCFPTKLPLLAGKRIITLTFTESIGFTDYGIYSRSIAKTFSESVGLSEASFKTITKQFTESIGISDKGITKTASKTFAEAIGLKDYGVYSKSITKHSRIALGYLRLSPSHRLRLSPSQLGSRIRG